MSLFQHQFQQQQQNQMLCNASLGNLYNIDGQISLPASYLNVDQPQQPQWFSAGADGDEYQLRKRVKEQDFLESNKNSQIACIDFMQARSVSTGLGLSLDNGKLGSLGDKSFLGIFGDEIDIELQRQDVEIDRLLKSQADRLRQGLLEKLQAKQLETLSYVEGKVLQKLREKEAELDSINRRNSELELRIEQLHLELIAWQQRAKQNEETINALKFNLEQIYSRNGDTKEGFGDSELDDTASCCNGRALDLNSGSMTCKVCGLNRVCMLLLPCKHMCVCKECESKVSLCPLCNNSKYMGLEVYM